MLKAGRELARFSGVKNKRLETFQMHVAAIVLEEEVVLSGFVSTLGFVW